MAIMVPERDTTEVTKPPVSAIGSQEDNRSFLVWLIGHGDTDMIERGCCLCRKIGHPFTEACRL